MTNPEITAHLAEIQAMEATAFRVGQVGRQLFQKHPGLASAYLSASAYGDSGTLQLDDPSVGCIEIDKWAALLGIELSLKLTLRTNPEYPQWVGNVVLSGQIVVDGVTVELRGVRLLTQEQWDAAQAEGEVPA
ncbi:hypothetical protein OG292_19610 [Streptomyces sp. NBC_01511]|uniref:hypothetical protein n=1 Tax=Streptomyces sp. NBC_01511 TaxID=2903889 RepID=UPI00386549BA